MRRGLNVLFWLFMALDLLVLGLWLLLGLAAAKPSHTGLPQLAAFFAVPTLLLAVVVWLYVRGPWAASRPLATVLAAVPAFGVLGVALMSRGIAGFMGMSTDDWGRPDPLQQQQIESSIRSGDTAAVAKLAGAPDARLNEGAALVAALRQLESQPDNLEPLRALLDAGVKPGSTGAAASPLAEGIRASRWAGPVPVQMLLDAGANPNQRHGTQPAWFAAMSSGTHPEVLPLLLARGADPKAVDMAGQTALHWAAFHRNWAAAATLVERGAEWRATRMQDGTSLDAAVSAQRRKQPGDPALEKLARLLR